MLSANPDARAEFWLSTAATVEKSKRPMFLVKFLTRRELAKHSELIQQAASALLDEKDGYKACDRLHDAIAVGVTGWKNVNDKDGKPREFNRAAIDNPETGLTDDELWELANRYIGSVIIGPRERINLESPSAIASGKSAAEGQAESTSPPTT